MHLGHTPVTPGATSSFWNPHKELIQEICYCGKDSFHQALGEIIETFIQSPLISKHRKRCYDRGNLWINFQEVKSKIKSLHHRCSFQAIQLRKKNPPQTDKKTTTDKLDPFMCPFNKIHLHSYLTTFFKSKGEQLPHAKHNLHSRVSTTVPTRDTQAGEGQGGVLRQHTPEHSRVLLVHYTEGAGPCSSSRCRPRSVSISTSRLIYRCFQPHPGESHRDTIWQSTDMAEMFSDQKETFQLLMCNFLMELCAFCSWLHHWPRGERAPSPHHHGLLTHPTLPLVPVVAQDLPVWIQLWIRN